MNQLSEKNQPRNLKQQVGLLCGPLVALTFLLIFNLDPNNPLVSRTTPGLDTTSWGGLVAKDETGQTSREGVFAGGDVVTGAATVILAAGAGKNAAKAINEYLTAKREKAGG